MKKTVLLYGYICCLLFSLVPVHALAAGGMQGDPPCGSAEGLTPETTYADLTGSIFLVLAKGERVTPADISRLLEAFAAVETCLGSDLVRLERFAAQDDGTACSFLLLLSKSWTLAALKWVRQGVRTARDLYCELYGCESGSLFGQGPGDTPSGEAAGQERTNPVRLARKYLKYARKLYDAALNGSTAVANAVSTQRQYRNCTRNINALREAP